MKRLSWVLITIVGVFLVGFFVTMFFVTDTANATYVAGVVSAVAGIISAMVGKDNKEKSANIKIQQHTEDSEDVDQEGMSGKAPGPKRSVVEQVVIRSKRVKQKVIGS